MVNKNFTSISLKWDPVQNTTGTAVYLIAITITGDAVLTHFFSEVRSNFPLAKNHKCFIVIFLDNHYGPEPILALCVPEQESDVLFVDV